MQTYSLKKVKAPIASAFIAGAALLTGYGENALDFNWGADLRLRHEIADNVPGNPGDSYAVLPSVRSKNKNHIRIRPRFWFEISNENFRLYTRLANEVREHLVENGTKRKMRAYNFPDEIFVDNLFLEGKDLESSWLRDIGIASLDFKFGRQDLYAKGCSTLGLQRIMREGTPLDGSRSFFADMAWTTLNLKNDDTIDLFTLYCSGRNELRWGDRKSTGRPLNPLNMADSDMDEWGGGIIYSGHFIDEVLPFKVYSIFKHSESYETLAKVPRRMPAKEVTTVGLLLTPEFSETWAMEAEVAKQFGRLLSGNRQAGGYMGHLELKYRPQMLKEYKTTISLASTYYSGDKHRTGADDNDTSWDPMWARDTQESELLVYGSLYGRCYWSNMIYSKIKLTMNFGKYHALYAYTGPMFTAVQDNLGHTDKVGHSMYKGMLSAARYDFPIRIAPEGAYGIDRIEMFGHIVGEVFNPGDYYETGKPSYFLRLEFQIKF